MGRSPGAGTVGLPLFSPLIDNSKGGSFHIGSCLKLDQSDSHLNPIFKDCPFPGAAASAAISPGGPAAGNEAVVERADDEPEIVELQLGSEMVEKVNQT